MPPPWEWPHQPDPAGVDAGRRLHRRDDAGVDDAVALLERGSAAVVDVVGRVHDDVAHADEVLDQLFVDDRVGLPEPVGEEHGRTAAVVARPPVRRPRPRPWARRSTPPSARRRRVPGVVDGAHADAALAVRPGRARDPRSEGPGVVYSPAAPAGLRRPRSRRSGGRCRSAEGRGAAALDAAGAPSAVGLVGAGGSLVGCRRWRRRRCCALLGRPAPVGCR